MIILGAGLSGLIAANMFRRAAPTVYEAQASVPNNHEALLRFRTDKVAQLTGIPFKKVYVRKFIVAGNTFAYQPNPYLCNQYSLKVTGEIRDRSVWNLDPDWRYVAPLDLINRIHRNLDIKFNSCLTFDDIKKLSEHTPVISTIPMPTLMKMAKWNYIPKFNYRSVWVVAFEIIEPSIDVYQTIYFCDEKPYYRASITGRKFMLEYCQEPDDDFLLDVNEVLDWFGIKEADIGGDIREKIKVKHMPYGKIAPIDEGIRQEFIYTMTRNFNIYSLGRFATWRQLLLDDVADDLKKIEALAMNEIKRRNYLHSLATVQ